MTEDSPSSTRGYGPFQEDAEPTAPIPAPTTAPPTTAQHPATSSTALNASTTGPSAATPVPPEPNSGYYAPAANQQPPSGEVPFSGSPHTRSGPFSEGRHSADPADPPNPTIPSSTASHDIPDFTTFGGRRIEPSPPPERNRLLIGLVAGLIAGLLLFGTGGWFIGRSTAPEAKPTATPAPNPTPALGIFEQSQVALNQPHFAGTGLTAISQRWLPYLSSCAHSGKPSGKPGGGYGGESGGESGGPTLNPGEKSRVRCTLDGMSAVFVEFKSISDRDRAQVRTLGQNVDARTLTPGVGPAVQRATPSSWTSGNYALSTRTS